ncbi:20990_t:CDS:2, partial [Cetraspora pellucida]
SISIITISTDISSSFSSFSKGNTYHTERREGLYGSCYASQILTECAPYDGNDSLTIGWRVVEAFHTIALIVSFALLIISFIVWQKNNNTNHALWTSTACAILVLASMIGEIAYFAIISKTFSSTNTPSVKTSLNFGVGFALIVLSFICTLVLIFIYWKCNSMSYEDKMQYNDNSHYQTSYNQNVGTIATPYQHSYNQNVGTVATPYQPPQFSHNLAVNNTATPYQPPQFSTPYQPPQFSNPYQ